MSTTLLMFFIAASDMCLSGEYDPIASPKTMWPSIYHHIMCDSDYDYYENLTNHLGPSLNCCQFDYQNAHY